MIIVHLYTVHLYNVQVYSIWRGEDDHLFFMCNHHHNQIMRHKQDISVLIGYLFFNLAEKGFLVCIHPESLYYGLKYLVKTVIKHFPQNLHP